ncbi:probable disease resistance protein RPP1 isoform X2 [Capsella rubella]|uniref:probable disease resistance protein RPP1 isoform X2 n=1 Tax=Capsella rubella TaxID=81985 RepID=UPI000CD556B3|nr:probable disease resistance protein RPP1 isoform X2 [Capsella rubella]
MTIFYEVDPTDIKKQIGDFGKAFRKTCKGKTKERTEIWRKALEDVAQIAGYHSRNWVNEAAMIDKIATDVSNMLNSSIPSRDIDSLVGMGAHMERMEQLLRLDLDEVRMIGICGPPGIVFLVLDDVDHLGQLDALAKEIQWFGPGSRIIITTEDQRVLKGHGIKHIYHVKFPSSDEAFQIFCMHAFGQKHPYKGFYELAKEVAYLAGELPLGLKILGSALRGRSKQEWKMMLPRLKTDLNGEIESIIKFSYDDLSNDDKDLFLYIACFFSTKGRDILESVLHKKFLRVTQAGLQVLTDKSLISIDTLGHIYMHTLLKQFGIETSRKQFLHHQLLKCQLLVVGRDICEVLGSDKTDNRSFIGINLDLSETKEELNISEKALARMSDLEIIRINGDKDFDPSQLERLHSLLYHSQKIRLLDWSYFQNTCLPSTFNLKFLVELDMCFSKLQKLWEGTKQLKNLRRMNLYLSKDLKELPDLSTATNLEDLFLKGCSSLVELPSSIGNATNLRELDLLGCSSLVELPSSIGNATNLHYLVLSQCSSLVELPSSIGNATNLQYLVLSQCSSLVELPSSIGNATSLRELNLSKCSKLVKIPSSIENLTNLEKLNLSDCFNLTELPLSIGTATNLRELNISGCSSLVNLPSSIGDLTNLKEFDLSNCSRLKSFPEISTNIEVLKLTGTAIKEVPMSIMSCSGLSDFRISYFESLKDFPHALDIITYLQLNEDIQEVSPWVKEMSCLRTLRLDNCKNLVSLPQFSDSLCEIDADNCQSLERLDCSFEDDYIGLEFRNCFKLNQEARDLIMHTWTATYAILPGTQVPVCFNHRATAEGSLTIKLNESCLPESLSFKACIMLVNINEETVDEHVSMRVNIKIMDKQNDLEVYINRALTEHIYTFDVEAEDVTSTELVFEFTTTNNSKWKIGECGVYQILEVP